jgi:GT2 family glycosyltransferase
MAAHFQSCMNLKDALNKSDFPHDWNIGWNESLITRGRDKMAAQFLKTDYEYLMWIDSDISFEPEDVHKLYELCLDGAKVAVGSYKMKKPDSKWTAWVNGEMVEVENLTEPTEVDYAGTGFMMIHRSVFDDMIEKHPDWKYTDSEGEIFGFYQDPVKDGSHLSEDYFFCDEYRKMGGKIILDPSIKLNHWGLYPF